MEYITTVQKDELDTQSVNVDLFDSFIKYIDASEKTIQTYTRCIRQFAKWLSLNGISQPQREDVLAYKESLKASGLKPTTIQTYIITVKIFFKWTDTEGLYPNVADGIKGAKLDRDFKKDYMTADQMTDVLKEIDRTTLAGKRDFAILYLMVSGGLRTIEVVRANVGDLRTLGEGTVLYIQGKGHTERTDFVKIPHDTEKVIRDYLRARGTVDDEAPLFASVSNVNAGDRMTTRSISRLVKTHLQSAGYDSERLTAHSLRHTAVTLSLLAGKDLAEVQQFARHKNIATTMIYSHALDKAKNGCSEAIASMLTV